MKHAATALLTVLAAGLCTFAQAQGTTAAPAADSAQATPPYKTVEPRKVADYQLPSMADPRVCLEFPTNAQIIACAERYRPGKRRPNA